MKKTLKFIKKYGIGFVLGAILSLAIGVKATTTFILDSTEVEYDNTLSGAAATTVRQALDYLNTKADALLAAQNSGNEEYQFYTVGTQLEVKGENYYVITESGSDEDYVTLLKDEPLTVAEINTYGVGHINRYAYNSNGVPRDENGYGAIQYYSSETCGSVAGEANVDSGCSSDYSASEIKYIIESWKSDKFTSEELAMDTLGYDARLITISELENLGYVKDGDYYPYNDNVPSWIYNSEYSYWTMSAKDSTMVWTVYRNHYVMSRQVVGLYSNQTVVVRPVINLKKSVLQS